MSARRPARLGSIAVVAFAGMLHGCAGDDGGGELHARKVVLEREVEGLREQVARLEGGERLLPIDDVVVAIEASLVRELVSAQLPLEVEVDAYHVQLDRVEVSFKESPLVTLEGSIALRERPDVSGQVRVLGALDRLVVDPESGTLEASIAVDHLDLLSVAGLEGLLRRGTLDDLARSVRLAIQGRIPDVTIPVHVQRAIELPAVTDGPVRLQGATMPVAAMVSSVVAGSDTLWVAIHLQLGTLKKTPGMGVGQPESPS